MNLERFRRGFLWGVLATVAMSVLMLVGVATGRAPMPEPIPKALAAMLLGPGASMPLLMGTAVLAHLGYGGFWAGMLWAARNPVGRWDGLALGVGLWVLMGLVALPLLGWGLFGTAVTPAVALATLGLHLVYGATLTWAADGSEAGVQRAVPG